MLIRINLHVKYTILYLFIINVIMYKSGQICLILNGVLINRTILSHNVY